MATHKYREILEKIQEEIALGKYQPGQRLPSEADLVQRYGASRMTVFPAPAAPNKAVMPGPA